MFARMDAIEDSLRENQEIMANWELEEGAYAEQNPVAEDAQNTGGQQAQPAATVQANAAQAASPPVGMAIDSPIYQQQTGWPPIAPVPAAPAVGTGSPAAHVSQLN